MNNRIRYEMWNKIREEKGSALMTMVVFFLVMVVLIFSISSRTLATFQESKDRNKHYSAYYIAETGLNRTVTLLKEDLNNLTHLDRLDLTEGSHKDFMKAISQLIDDHLKDGKYEIEPGIFADIEFLETSEDDTYEIRATGVYDSQVRTVSQTIMNLRSSVVSPVTEFVVNDALLADKKLILREGVIEGNIGIINPVKQGLFISTRNQTKVNGNIFIGKGYKPEDILIRGNDYNPNSSNYDTNAAKALINSGQVVNGTEYPALPQTRMPKFPTSQQKIKPSDVSNPNAVNNNGNLEVKNGQHITLKLKNRMTYIPQLKVVSSWDNSLTIDTENRNVAIITDYLEAMGTIYVKGSGRLTIYVNGHQGTPNLNFNPITFMNIDSKTKGDKDKIVIFAENSKKHTGIKITPDEIILNRGAANIDSSGYFGSFMGECHSINISQNLNANIILVEQGSSVEITSASPQVTSELFFIPNGSIRYGSNYFKGAIVAQEIEFMGSNPKIYYKDPDFTKFPIEILMPVSSEGNGPDNPGQSDEIKLGPIKEVKQ
ncbi:MAG: hypothetical protein RR565_08005 [Erysipelothrix sp.]